MGNLYQENRLQYRSNAIIGYSYTEYPRGKGVYTNEVRRFRIKEAKIQAYSGQLTTGAKKRLTKAIELLVQSTKPVRIMNTVTKKRFTHRLSFITLTIHQAETITAKEAHKKALEPFLKWMRDNHKVNTYIWKVEKQKRGQIHYHITTPTFIEHHLIKDKWNNLCSKAGWLKDYYDKHKHFNPNSTDIHEVRSVHNLSGYMIKEFCKAVQNPMTDGKVWDCSLNLKKYGYYTMNETIEQNKIIVDIIDTAPTRVKPMDFCHIFITTGLKQTVTLSLQNMQGFDDHIQKIRTYRRE